MEILYRPHEGRLVGGVALAFNQRFGLSLPLLRAFFAAVAASSEYGIILYFLMWLSMPGERKLLPRLQLAGAALGSGSTRFEDISGHLIERFRHRERPRAWSAAFAFLLLFIAVVLQLSNLDESMFYNEHPILSSLLAFTERFGGILSYVALSILFLQPLREMVHPQYVQQERPRIALDRGPGKVIFGLLSGIARSMNVDPFVLRAAAVLLSGLTFGAIAVFYLIAVVILDKTEGTQETELLRPANSTEPMPKGLRMLTAVLFMLLALVRLSTDFRLFFFNEPYVQGLIFVILGVSLFVWSLKRWSEASASRMWMLLTPALVFWGIYELSRALFFVQLPFVARFQVGYLIAGTAFIYYAIVTLRGRRLLYGITTGVMFYLFVLLIQFNILPSNALLLLVQFYEFFNPVLFAGAGLWVVMEK